MGPDLAGAVEAKGGLKLLEKLADVHGVEPVVMQAVAALSRLQRGLKEVKSTFQGSKSKDIQWGAVLALAQYSRDEKDAADAAKTITTKCFKEGEGQIKNFAVLAAGDLAGRLDPNSKVREGLVKFLLDVLDQKDNYVRSCAALALGCANQRSAIPALTKLLDDPTCDNHALAAACLGLGLLRATESADAIRNSVLVPAKPSADARGYAAVGLALMGDTTQIDALKEFHLRKDLNSKTLRQTPLALGVLGDRGTVNLIVECFSKGFKQNEKFYAGNAAFGLGWVRDESALDDLANLATKAADRDVRGMAVIALGYTAARDRLNPLSRVIENVSHRNRFLWAPLDALSWIL
jgi:hypothetical protein